MILKITQTDQDKIIKITPNIETTQWLGELFFKRGTVTKYQRT